VTRHLTLVGLLLTCVDCYAQLGQENISMIEARQNQVYVNHEDADVAQVLTGKKYSLRYLGAKNSQFFLTDQTEFSSLTYDGIKFDTVEMQYDLFAQKIVVLLESKRTAEYVSVDDDKVYEFILNDCLFVQVKQDSIMKEGIYQLAFDGDNTSVLIKRKKRRIEKVEAGKLAIIFQPFDNYYVKNEYGTFKVSGKKDLLNAFQNSEKLKSLIKKRKIKFSKKVKEKGIIAAVSLFDSELTAN
jgi:hypothetical protein